MTKTGSRLIALFSVLAFTALFQSPAAAVTPFNVYVGYADGLRGAGFFPSPWQGDPNVTFLGISDNANDAGAILIQNTSGANLTINSIGVTINFSGNVAPPWTLPVTIPANGLLILTETGHYNFDTSDISFIPGATYGSPATDCSINCPKVTIGWDGGSSVTLNDSKHTLDTEGFDFAANGSNESFNWRLIGDAGCSGPGCGGGINPLGGAPEPSTWAMMLLGFAGLGFMYRRRAKTALMAA